MNKEQIEKKSVSFLEDFLESTSLLQTDFYRNDKTPITDGCIRLYNIKEGEQRRKEKFIDQINVQIKGTTMDSFLKTKKYNISKDDLIGLKKLGGGIFFVVYVGSKGAKIFLKTFLPFELYNLKLTKNSKSFEFSLLDNDISEVIYKFKNFILHKNKQPKCLLDIRTLKPSELKLSTTVISKDRNKACEELNRGITVYHKTEEGIEIPYGLIVEGSERIASEKLIRTFNGYELNLKILKKVNSKDFTLFFENYLTLDIKNKVAKLKLEFKNLNTLEEILKALVIFDDIINCGFFINDKQINIGGYFDKDKLEEVFDLKDKYIDMCKMFEVLNISKKIKFLNLSEETKKQLDIILDLWKTNNSIEPKIYKFYIEDCLYYILIGPKMFGNVFLLDDLFILKFEEDWDYEIPISFYPTERLEIVKDFNTDHIIENVKGMLSKSQNSISYLNDYVLILIKNYDYSKDEKFLRLSEEIMLKILEIDTSNTFLINYYQIILRIRKLTFIEIQGLKNILNRDIENIERACINILLKQDIKKFEKLLSDDEMSELKNWPIYKLV